MAKFTDPQIRELAFVERKFLKKGWVKKVQLKDTRSGKEGNVNAEGEFGNKFKIIAKQSKFNKDNFCLTLGVYPVNSNSLFRLLRYDGKDAHTNKGLKEDAIQYIEFDFHIHMATERYQNMGLDEEYYAEPTDRYENLNEALDCMLQDCSFVLPEGESMNSLLGRFYGQWS